MTNALACYFERRREALALRFPIVPEITVEDFTTRAIVP